MIVETMHCDSPQGCRETTLVGAYKGGWFAVQKGPEDCITVTSMTSYIITNAYHACCFDCAMKVQHKLLQGLELVSSQPSNVVTIPSASPFLDPIIRRGTCPICEETFELELTQEEWNHLEETGELPRHIEEDPIKEQIFRQNVCQKCILAAMQPEVEEK